MQITLYKDFGKRKNSTLQPSAEGITKNVQLKRATSVLHPTFILSDPDPNYNYVKWRWRYYYIDDISLQQNDIYEIHCTIDPLASWRAQILASTQYVVRTGNITQDYCSGFYIDNLYPTEEIPTVSSFDLVGFPGAVTQGYYVVMFGGLALYASGGQRVDASCFYISAQNFSTFTEKLAAACSKNGTSWTDYIKRVTYFPEVVAAGTAISSIILDVGSVVGQHVIPVSCVALADLQSVHSYIMEIKSPSFNPYIHPQALSRGLWLNGSTATKAVINYGVTGTIDLPIDLMQSYAWVYLKLWVDYMSGGATAIISGTNSPGGTETVLSTFDVPSFGTDVFIAQTQSNVRDIGTSVVSAAVSGGANIAVIADVLDPVKWAGQVQTLGGSGTRTKFTTMSLVLTFYRYAAEDYFNRGRPCMTNVQLSELQGFYVQCANVRFTTTSSPSERDEIISLLESGVYLD